MLCRSTLYLERLLSASETRSLPPIELYDVFFRNIVKVRRGPFLVSKRDKQPQWPV